jgi:hypothetical protein
VEKWFASEFSLVGETRLSIDLEKGSQTPVVLDLQKLRIQAWM